MKSSWISYFDSKSDESTNQKNDHPKKTAARGIDSTGQCLMTITHPSHYPKIE